MNLEKDSRLTSFDYEYLKGDWRGVGGAAYNYVSEWCLNKGYGLYGLPTKRGQEAMKQYEQIT